MGLSWLFGRKEKKGFQGPNDECAGAIDRLKEDMPDKVTRLKQEWQELAQCDLALDEESLPTGVEACLWSLNFLKMVEEAESRGVGGDGISERLETLQALKDEEGTGCRIRYARGILQDYASSGRGYDSKQKALFVGEWLFNCNKDALKGGEAIGSVGAYRRLGEVLLGDDSKRSWFN